MNRTQRRAHDRAIKRIMNNAAKRRPFEQALRQEAAARPMDPDQIRDLVLYAHAAMAALVQGMAQESDLHSLAAISNISMLLAERGYGDEYLPDIKTAQAAVVSAFDRFARTGKVGVSGPELAALNVLVELHEAQMDLRPTQGEMSSVLAEIRARQSAGHTLEVSTC